MIYRSVLRPILFRLPPETAHELALSSLSVLHVKPIRNVIASRYRTSPFSDLKRFNLEFRNPVGLAAGFDKNGTEASALSALGFGFVEVGTVTNEPQSGNQKPRLFRLPADHALINRLGFNNCGAQQLARNLKERHPDCVLGINIGKSRSVPIDAAIPDYVATFKTIYDAADYITVNVSSPNTPNLRELQRHDRLQDLLSSLQQTNDELARAKARERKPLLIKIAPDLDQASLEAIIDVANSTEVAGIIATNTTVSRDRLQTPRDQVEACGQGGLSGAPLRDRANEIISFIYRNTGGTLPIIGVGGVFTAAHAWEKICSGAGLIQLYTGFIYEGPAVAKRINEGLLEILEREGLRSLNEAVGCRVK